MNRRTDNERIYNAFVETFTIDQINANPRLGVIYSRIQQVRGTYRQFESWFLMELATLIMRHENG